MTVVTTHVRAGYLRKNGVPYSENAALTEYFDVAPQPNGGPLLVVTTVVDDPRYLQQRSGLFARCRPCSSSTTVIDDSRISCSPCVSFSALSSSLMGLAWRSAAITTLESRTNPTVLARELDRARRRPRARLAQIQNPEQEAKGTSSLPPQRARCTRSGAGRRVTAA